MKKKGQNTYDNLVAAAVQSFSKFGDKGTTFQSIADLAGVSQPLVAKYFKTRDAVLPAAIDNFLSAVREQTLQSLEGIESGSQQLKTYLKVTFNFFRNHPEHFRVYLLLHYYAGFDKKFLQINSEIKSAAVMRVKKMIEVGISQGEFKPCNTHLVAKVIHNSLVGNILGIVTESPTFTDIQLQKTIQEITFGYLHPVVKK